MDFRSSLRTARQYSVNATSGESKGCCGYFLMAGAILGVIILVLFTIAIIGLGIAKLVIGGIYFHDCELQPLLPIFLIVDACVAILLGCRCQCQCGGTGETGEESEQSLHTKIWKAIVGLFQLAWLVCGTIWVVGVRDVIYSPGHCDPSTTTTTTAAPGNSSIILGALTNTTTTAVPGAECVTCNEVLTDFTFAIVIIQWVLAGLAVLAVCCGLVGFCVKRD